ncbi:hypothetical protein JOE58_002613 [Curtobacterium luteum]|uniref:Zinc-ribbon domain-containing protein n=1 Tax=Curtobacterium luteum TaxID=33881 RepID=A0ABS2RY50_9MICO|nr:hypothetical protein [Curtobacterium luteum]
MGSQESSRATRASAFVTAAKLLHGEKYGYDRARTEYVNGKESVPIFCRHHARVFWQLPHDHLKGQGCPDCGGRRGASIEARRSKFLATARRVHAGRYRYDVESFVAAKLPVRIECPVHGWFRQRATNHLQGQGCSDCRLPNMRGSRRRR